MLDRETGRNKGFRFVPFEDANVQPFPGFGNLIGGKLYRRDDYPNGDGAAGSDFVQGSAGGIRFSEGRSRCPWRHSASCW
ncbi:hypothetical protein BD779DRAFT_1561768 [Infundibulicybe gibba]|nr:hypothetical protein BD779DRAFT_1561768 [Infundibulicybe gibba]